MQQLFQQAANLIKSADGILIGAGAGMGVDSGLPDFRGNEGFWKAYPPLRKSGFSFVDMANPSWFDRDPEFAWGFYGHRLNLYQETTPHRGFAILLKWTERKDGNAFVFTSNVDGHFQRAGFAENQVYECHGSIHFLQCRRNCHLGIWPSDAGLDVDENTLRATTLLPTCPRCQETARPNILMFGDGWWNDVRAGQQQRHFQKFLASNSGLNLVVVELGAGTAVPTVRHLCENWPEALIRINPREPQTRGGDSVSISCGALEALESIEALM